MIIVRTFCYNHGNYLVVWQGKDMDSENNQEILTELALELYDIEAVKFGNFTLHSGKKSRIYLDLRLLASYPRVMRLAASAYRQVLERLDFDLLAATPLAGLPIGTAVSLDMDIPLIYPRQSTKSYGTGKQIEGKWEVGQTAVVVDDLITSGDSLLQGIAFLKAAGLHVNDAVVLIDREQGGKEILLGEGYQLHSAVSISHILEILEENGRVSSKKYDKILKSIGLN
jgi:uridine monophosphate synthetase